MGAVSVFMTGNYLRQPVDDDGPLSLRWWSQLVISLCLVFFVVLCGVSKHLCKNKTQLKINYIKTTNSNCLLDPFHCTIYIYI